MINRTAIFAFYDEKGVVDDYVTTLLDGLRPHCSYILCVINGEITDSGKKTLEDKCDEVIERSNSGFDIMAYKEGYGRVSASLTDVDELLFFNATVFGPIYPFLEMFDKMDKNTHLDFWGITKYAGHYEGVWGLAELGRVPEHIQSYFFSVRKRMFSSKEFHDYWKDLPSLDTYEDAVSFHEMLFTEHFSNLGYKWDTYIKVTDEESFKTNLIMADPVRLLKKQRCPVVKRKSFFLYRTELPMPISGYSGRQLFEFLKTETDFDTSLIVKNITRTQSNRDYSLALGLVVEPDKDSFLKTKPKISIIYFINNVSELKRIEKISKTPNAVKVAFCKDTKTAKSAKELLPKDFVIEETANGDFYSIMSDSFKKVIDTDYQLFLNIVPSMVELNTKQEKMVFENTSAYIYASHEFSDIEGIVGYLEKNPEVGIVAPLPDSRMGDFFQNTNWRTAFSKVKDSNKYNFLSTFLTEPLHISEIGFLCRTETLKTLIDMLDKLNDLPPESYGYLPPFAAQYNKSLLAFAYDKLIIENLYLNTYAQLRRLAEISSSEIYSREDQIVNFQSAATEFFRSFFSRKFKSKIYFILMALLNRKWFLKLQNLFGKHKDVSYPGDAYFASIPRKR